MTMAFAGLSGLSGFAFLVVVTTRFEFLSMLLVNYIRLAPYSEVQSKKGKTEQWGGG